MKMTDENTKIRNWQRILLVGSLAANLAVLGIVAGIAFGGGPQERLQRFDLSIGPLTRALDDDRRDAVRDQLRDSGAFRSGSREDMRRDTVNLLETLRADSFDAQVFTDIVTRQRARQEQGQGAVLSTVIAQISQMDVAERAAFADRIEQQLRRPPPRRD